MKQYETYKDSGVQWLGDIPGHWEVVPMKRLFSFGKGLSITKSDLVESGQPVISYGQIHSKQNPGTHVEDCLLRYVPQTYINENDGAAVSPGDFIFADTSEDLAGCGNAVYVDKESIYAGYHTVILRSRRERSNNKYLAYLFLTDLWRSQIRSMVFGVKVYSITRSALSQTSLIIPPTSEQEVIASYLDNKVGQIDSLIDEKERQMKELQQYRVSLISETVTRGLNPDVKMKESGVEWLGRIPEHWEVVELKKLLSEKLKYGASEQGTAYDESLPRYIRITDFDSNGRLKEENKLSLPFEKAKDYLLENNDVLFARSGATVGKSFIFLVDDHTDKVCCFAGYLIRAKCDSSKLLPMFLFSYTNSYSFGNWKNMIATKATIENISADKYATLPIPVPPLSEQQAIASFLDDKTARIDSTMKELETQIADLRCYKTSVITEAVTGKVDVRQWKQT